MISQYTNNILNYSFPEMDGESRARELILYIADKCLNDPTFGKTKLNKILWFADFLSYVYYGEAITGIQYQHKDFGPVPCIIDDLQEEMQAERDLVLKRIPVYDYERTRIISLRQANLDNFKPRDIALIDNIIQVFWGKRATDVSELSHGKAWNYVNPFESIPYQAALLSDEGITNEDIQRTKELAEQYGWEIVRA